MHVCMACGKKAEGEDRKLETIDGGYVCTACYYAVKNQEIAVEQRRTQAIKKINLAMGELQEVYSGVALHALPLTLLEKIVLDVNMIIMSLVGDDED